MASRKRQRPNPSATGRLGPSGTTSQPDLATSLGPSVAESASSDQRTSTSRGVSSAENSIADTIKQKTIRKARSWYGPWTQSSKASPSTSVARENISGGTVRSRRPPDLSRFDLKSGGEAASLSNSPAAMPPLPKIPEQAVDGRPVDGSSDSAVERNGNDERNRSENQELSSQGGNVTQTQRPETDIAATSQNQEPSATPQRPATSSGWLGWLSRTPLMDSQPALTAIAPADKSTDKPAETQPASNEGAEPTRPSTPPASISTTTVKQDEAPKKLPASSSWFGMWPLTSETVTESGSAVTNSTPEPETTNTDSVAVKDTSSPDHQSTPKAGSTWAFWSKDSPKSTGKLVKQESGEIAVIGEGSEAHPKPMAEDDVSSSPSNNAKSGSKAKEIQPGGRSTWRKPKRIRPASMDISPSSSLAKDSASISDEAPNLTAQASVETFSSAKTDTPAKPAIGATSPAKLPPNLLLPSFHSTYRLKENPSIIKQVAQLLLRTSQPPANHVFRNSDVPKVRKAIAIGVHGLFPATYLRPMIGQPTGTSLRFANFCADAIRKWADEHGSPECEIEKVALEGEGKIGERVENLWKLLLNWIDHLRSADLIIMASHSQGVPVSVMLLEKLIDLGLITNARIGVCAMAGVSLGPFPEYKSSILMGSAAELWEFGDPNSGNSQRFEIALKRILDYGARVTFVGSIDDQLVPMESAVYSPAHHPNIYRAVFIDGRIHAPDFIAHLIGFALKLRNLGISDHGLIRELSLPLAGSLYGGEGHSRIYYDPAVYDLAIAHALETTSAPNASFVFSKRDSVSTPNPYVLPWIMRGMLEEDLVKTELSSETEELLRQFDDWKPTTKALKDVKYRLEAVRSRL
ncbi:hypothetical protein S7711_03350 [Stachybotrys chartarum IBT 7711]|uniref:YMC020W-like alpha/beta hydrolase domain-containing protein n=1 Tax=Stachybotrys chartarum (strain CBS 109288 / IBT 7711) TaxID=1280523 RepID=A0A084AUS3_STACB|nr:hypothetical protein S7711_03350 [Stachybotrys chartarum IBT 7711]